MKTITAALRKAFVFIMFWRLGGNTKGDMVTLLASKPCESLIPETVRAIAKPRIKRADDAWSLSALLDRLDEEHERFGLKAAKWSMIDKHHQKALLKFGPLILPESVRWYRHDTEQRVFDEIIGTLPPIQAYIGWHTRARRHDVPKNGTVFSGQQFIEKSGEEHVRPIAIFAVRDDPKTPWNVQKTPGIRYIVGWSVAFNDGQEVFAAAYATVDFDTGKIYVPKSLNRESVTVPGGGMYSRQRLSIANAEYFAAQGGDEQECAESYIRSSLASLLRVWSERGQYYQVSTRKKGGRVTFCVPAGDQVRFFKDRDKTAIANDGKRKRIVHYVNAHDRQTPTKTTTVMEHLRGVRKFTWNGYSVSVLVPKFHIEGYSFPLGPVSADKIPREERKHYLSAKQVSEMLADIEDNREYRHGNS